MGSRYIITICWPLEENSLVRWDSKSIFVGLTELSEYGERKRTTQYYLFETDFKTRFQYFFKTMICGSMAWSEVWKLHFIDGNMNIKSIEIFCRKTSMLLFVKQSCPSNFSFNTTQILKIRCVWYICLVWKESS